MLAKDSDRREQAEAVLSVFGSEYAKVFREQHPLIAVALETGKLAEAKTALLQNNFAEEDVRIMLSGVRPSEPNLFLVGCVVLLVLWAGGFSMLWILRFFTQFWVFLFPLVGVAPLFLSTVLVVSAGLKSRSEAEQGIVALSKMEDGPQKLALILTEGLFE